jgi:hypothetical protein
MDFIWYGLENGVPAAAVAADSEVSEVQVHRACRDLARRAQATEYLCTPAVSFPLNQEA